MTSNKTPASPVEELPFVCPHCSERFGWGDSSSAPIFLGIVTSLLFTDEITPCCKGKISGTLVRVREEIEMNLMESTLRKGTE